MAKKEKKEKKSNKEKKDSNLLVILLILVLLLLIILPPTFRTLFPREEKSSKTSEDTIQKSVSTLSSLSCRKITTDGFNVVVNTSYQKNDVSKINITYAVSTQNNNTTTEPNNTPAENTTVDQTQTTAPQVQDNVLAEIEALKSIENIKANENANTHQFIIEMKNFTYNTIPEVLKTRVQSLSLQQAFYESNGYTCSRINP